MSTNGPAAPIDVHCDACGSDVLAPARLTGRAIECPECGEPIPVPGRPVSLPPAPSSPPGPPRYANLAGTLPIGGPPRVELIDRVLAGGVDALLVCALSLSGVVAERLIGEPLRTAFGLQLSRVHSASVLLPGVVGFTMAAAVLGPLYYLVQIATASTPGKLVFNLVVGDERARHATGTQLAVRYLCLVGPGVAALFALLVFWSVEAYYCVSAAGWVIGIGLFAALGVTHQALHDRIAGTAVYRRSELVATAGRRPRLGGGALTVLLVVPIVLGLMLFVPWVRARRPALPPPPPPPRPLVQREPNGRRLGPQLSHSQLELLAGRTAPAKLLGHDRADVEPHATLWYDGLLLALVSYRGDPTLQLEIGDFAALPDEVVKTRCPWLEWARLAATSAPYTHCKEGKLQAVVGGRFLVVITAWVTEANERDLLRALEHLDLRHLEAAARGQPSPVPAGSGSQGS